MKIRVGFVSNSSSSSFVLDKRPCSPAQLEALRNHTAYAEKHFHGFYASERDAWSLDEKETEIYGFTYMDNFDMYAFMQKLGIPDEAIDFDGGGY